GRGLARAVRAQQAEDLAGCDVERDAVDGQDRAVGLVDLSDLDHCPGGGEDPRTRRNRSCPRIRLSGQPRLRRGRLSRTLAGWPIRTTSVTRPRLPRRRMDAAGPEPGRAP